MQDSLNTRIIPRDTLAERVYAAIKARILEGEFRQGERIGELAVSQEFGVSSTPVREALRLLHGDGLIQYEGRRGARVIQPLEAEVRHSYEAREALECAALRSAVDEFSADDVRDFLELARQTTQCSKDPLEFLKADRTFHEFFIRKSDNGLFLKYLTEIAQFLLVVRLPRVADWKVHSAAREHVEIAQAVADKESERAVSLLRAHIQTSCRWAIGNGVDGG